ncbi:MAG TPA: glutathione peroxidase [Polyangiaceae bacterium]|jgi:glutathione peroxidase|nr:glutathione peroxidase [Polyangiaceae bacterium]
MRGTLPTVGVCLAALLLDACRHAPKESQTMTTTEQAVDIYGLSAKTLEGQPAPLAEYRGQVTLLVNVASACGYTPQYAGLERVYTKYKDKRFAVLGFPSNDFGRQEPGSPEEIREFCVSKYRVDFPMFEKVQTKAGPGQSEIYAALERSAGALPSWNFGKYLISRSGKVLKFYPSKVDPEDAALIQDIEAAIDAGA